MEALETSSICRLCADIKQHVFRIYDEEGYKLAIGIKINKYLQIQIDEKDSLPKNVCWECYSKLEECSNFVNNSQNAQITLSQKIFSLYDNENSMKGETLMFSGAVFEEPANLLNFNNEQMPKDIESPNAFECNSLNLSNSNASCYYNDKTTFCMYEERNETEEQNVPNVPNVPNSTDENHASASDCVQSSCNSRKRINKRKCGNPVRYLTNNPIQTRTKRKLCKKKQLNLKKKRTETLADEDEYDLDEAELFKQKYFSDLPWLCAGCSQTFPTLNELQNHYATFHMQSLRFMCPHCYKVYVKYKRFAIHIKKNLCTSMFVCGDCSKVFTSKRLLELHRQMHNAKPQLKCEFCDKTFKQASGLYMHSKCHLPKHLKSEFVCDQCDKIFSTKPNLTTHKKIHTGMRNYICDLCGKSFVQKGNLCAHMLVHSDTKQFTCGTCNKEFRTAMQLRKHTNIHSGKKPHQCDICGRMFRERGTLREHYRIHTGAMPFSCEFCGKAFRFKGVLTTHRRQHTGERPYSCVECQHHFTNWPNYNKHMKRKHGINKSVRIKSDIATQNGQQISAEQVGNAAAADIEIPSFEDTLQPVTIDSDKSMRLYDEPSSQPYLLSHQGYNNTSGVQQNNLLNAYYSMTTMSALQVMNPTGQTIDLMNTTLQRDYM